MNNKFAPGPWIEKYPIVYSAIGSELLHIDEHDCCTIHDARLIAAAPDLLEALQSYSLAIDENNIALSCIEFGAEAVERELKARAAIAKATGATP